MRLYEMIRDEDVSGVSGTGPVAEVCEFDNGWCAVAFYGFTAGVPNVIVYGSFADVEKIHGHQGRTYLTSRDNPGQFRGEDEWKPAPSETRVSA